MSISVLIADDDPAVREALADLVSDESTLELVAVAANADDAIQFAADHQPTVALLDVRMPGGGGPRAAREIALCSPATRILAISVYEEKASVYEMLDLGVCGYLVKGASEGEIVEAIHRTARGQLSMSSELATACFKELIGEITGRKRDEGKRIIAVARDVTDQKRAEQELEASLDTVRKIGRERQELLAHLVQAQEAERLRIASDIHDDTIQAMTVAGLRLQPLRKRLSTPTELEALAKLEDAIQGSIGRLRHLMFNLRPVALDRTGLAAALRAQLEPIQASAGLAFELENQLTTEPPPDTSLILYRIAMEALANVRKHAQARRVTVRLEDADQGWRVQIDDDGSGFIPPEGGSEPGHLGLTAMRERAQMARGWWKVESRPGSGTRVSFWLPAALATNATEAA